MKVILTHLFHASLYLKAMISHISLCKECVYVLMTQIFIEVPLTSEKVWGIELEVASVGNLKFEDLGFS